MTIRTISKQPTGGATEKKDQLEWTTDGPSVGKQERVAQILIVFDWLGVSCVPDFTFRHSQGGTLLCPDRER
jgi:hypothetical protein